MADLFDGLFADLPPAAAAAAATKPQPQGKRPAPSPTDDDASSKKPRATEEEKEEQEGDKTAAKKPQTVDLHEALQKVSKALVSSKPEKVHKAMELLLKLLTSDMNVENAPQFHAALAFFMASDGAWDRLLEERAQTARLCAVLKERILHFPPDGQYAAASWILVGQLRADLLTDDTFEFRRATRLIKEYITALQSFAEEKDTFAEKERRNAILACLATALRQNLHQWAKPSIEDLFKTATEKRMFFPPEEREELDEMATKLRNAARGLSVNPGGGSIVGRSVRMVNSMATPFNTKKGDIYR